MMTGPLAPSTMPLSSNRPVVSGPITMSRRRRDPRSTSDDRRHDGCRRCRCRFGGARCNGRFVAHCSKVTCGCDGPECLSRHRRAKTRLVGTRGWRGVGRAHAPGWHPGPIGFGGRRRRPAPPLYRDLNDPAGRLRRDMEQSVFVVEGGFAVDRLLTSSYSVRSLLIDVHQLTAASDLVSATRAAGAPVFVASRAVVADTVGFALHRGIVAVANRPSPLIRGACWLPPPGQPRQRELLGSSLSSRPQRPREYRCAVPQCRASVWPVSSSTRRVPTRSTAGR